MKHTGVIDHGYTHRNDLSSAHQAGMMRNGT